MKEHLDFKPAKDFPELVNESIYKVVKNSPEILVGQIDPRYMNGVALSDHYDVNLEDGANCIIVTGKRGEKMVKSAIVAPVGYRADLNGIVSKILDVRKVSMAPLDEIIRETGMEYGSITPIGLPETWKILIDSQIMDKKNIIVGGGKKISKLLIPTSFLSKLPNLEIVEDLAYKT